MTAKNKAKYILPIMVLCTMLVLTVSVLGAYIGRGIKKGVLVASSYYFESDVLGSIHTTGTTDAEYGTAVNAKPVSCLKGSEGVTEKEIQIMNFKSSIEYDLFDVSYSLKLWLSEADTADYDYYYKIGTGSYTQINSGTAISYSTAVNESRTLTGNEQDTDMVTVKWVWKGGAEPENINLASKICIIAEPVSPTHMSQLRLGAVLNIGTSSGQTAAFSYTAGFYEPEAGYTGRLENYAGFVYRVTTTGIPTNNETLTLTWDPLKLDLSPVSRYAEGVANGSLTLELEGNKIYELVFYRHYDGWVVPTDEVGSTLNINAQLTTGTVTP